MSKLIVTKIYWKHFGALTVCSRIVTVFYKLHCRFLNTFQTFRDTGRSYFKITIAYSSCLLMDLSDSCKFQRHEVFNNFGLG